MRKGQRRHSSFKHRIIIVALLSCLFPNSLFAQTASADPLGSNAGIIQAMNEIIALASRVRVIPAKLAGLFMTNAFVYGEKFYLTQYLFKFWQIIRTFAYFTLGFYFIGNILYTRFRSDGDKTGIPTLIKNTIISGFLIGGSWWLIAACVDLSIVFTSALASIPTQIYETKWAQEKQQCFNAPKVITISQMRIDPNLLSNADNRKTIERKDIKPDGDDVSGPLTFFGIGVLGFFDMVHLPEGVAGSEQRIDSKTIILVFVKAIMALMLVIPMVTLMIVNLIRIVYLRLWIVFSPFIVLINVFGIELSDGIKKHIDRKNMLGLMMQPVAVIGMLSVGVILIIELATIFNLCTKPNGAVGKSPLQTTIGSTIPTVGDLGSNAGAETSIGASLSALGDTIGGLTGELILAIFVIMLLRSLFKVGFSFSSLTSGVAKSISDGAENMMGAIPIIPIGNGQSIGVTTAKREFSNGFGLPDAMNQMSHKQQDKLMDKMGLNKGRISSAAVEQLKILAEKPNTKLSELKSKIQTEIKEKKISQTQAQEIVSTWLNGGGKNDPEAFIPAQFSKLKGLTTEQLKTLWSHDTTKESAFRLLNWLFANNKDYNTTTDDYGGSSSQS